MPFAKEYDIPKVNIRQYVYFINQKLLFAKTELVGKYKSLYYLSIPASACML